MKGEIMHFRRKMFGGFNQDDVAAYIAKIAQERNESLEAKNKADREMLAMQGEIARLRETLDQYEKLIERLRNNASVQPPADTQPAPGAIPGPMPEPIPEPEPEPMPPPIAEPPPPPEPCAAEPPPPEPCSQNAPPASDAPQPDAPPPETSRSIIVIKRIKTKKWSDGK